MGKVATQPLPPRASPPLPRGGKRQKCPTSGQCGYITPTARGVPTASERRGQNQRWPTGGQRGYITPTALGSPSLQSGGHKQGWPTSGQGATSALPPRVSPPLGAESEVAPARGAHRSRAGGGGGVESEVAHSWARWLHGPATWGVRPTSERRADSEVAHKWARWLRNPCHLGSTHRFKAGGAESEVAYKWARWLHNPYRLGGSAPLQGGGQNQRWSISGWRHNPCRPGVPTASERGAE